MIEVGKSAGCKENDSRMGPLDLTTNRKFSSPLMGSDNNRLLTP